MRLRNLAIEGKNNRAFDELHRLTKKYQPREPDKKLGVLLVPETSTVEEEKALAEIANAEALAKRSSRVGP